MKNRSGPRALSLFALALVLLLPSRGRGQTPPEEAREHYRKGTAAYNLGKYAEAAQEYELSYRATLDPALLFNVAQAYRLAGDRKKALTAYKSYLRSAPDGDRRDLAEAKVREIEAALNYEDPFTAGGSEPSPKAVPVPTPAPTPVTARTLPLMEATPPTTSPASVLVETPSRPASAAFYRRWPFWAAAGAAVAAVVIVVVAESGASSPQAPTTTYGTMRF